jgi:SCY1-like protein 3
LLESIFITENSTWKLHGMEHVFKSADITEEFLQKSRPYRNQASIDPNEKDGTGLEAYAFATLCEVVIKKNSKIPFAQEFLAYCKNHLKHKNVSLRPLLSAVQLHDFFNHDFVQIHNFLTELSLKTQPAKLEFFKTLAEKLKQFDENVIGSQLSDLLLSRLVLLDQSAQYYFIPYLLKPQNLEDDEENSTDEFLFTTVAFIKYIVPKLKQVFHVLDVQIRLVLLENFHLYVNTFSKQELTDIILPQLLLGIKDTNDLLVTKTLLCLCELIPILGASLVVCKNRRKIFADGRPQQTEMWINNINEPRSITPVINSSIDILSSSPVDLSDSSLRDEASNVILESGTLSDSKSDNIITEPMDNELTDNENLEVDSAWNWNQDAVESKDIIVDEIAPALVTTINIKDIKPVTASRPKIDDNIDSLDIKNKKLTKLEEQAEDFFNDFEMTSTPSFQKTSVIVEKELNAEMKVESSRLQMSMVAENECWDENNWGDDEEL